MEKLTWAVHDAVPPEAGGIVDNGLGQFVLAHGASGAVVGGAVGCTWGECCELLFRHRRSIESSAITLRWKFPGSRAAS